MTSVGSKFNDFPENELTKKASQEWTMCSFVQSMIFHYFESVNISIWILIT